MFTLFCLYDMDVLFIRYLACATCCFMGINLVISDEFWRSKAYHKIINFPRGNLSCVLDRNKYLLLGNCKLHICKVQHEWMLMLGSCLIYVICFCVRIVVSNTYCVVFLFCFSSSCVPYVGSFSRLSILIALSVFSSVY
jgi:hypothetical protein